jgi:hypothetical protein
LNTNGAVECEIYSKTEPKLLCVFFEPKSSVKKLLEEEPKKGVW